MGTTFPNPARRRCFECGRSGHLARNCCFKRPRDVECHFCGKKGHSARNCWQQGNYQGNVSTRRAGDTYSQASIDARHIECVPTLSDTIKSKAAYIQGKVNDHYLDILLDSGASCSVMHDEYVIPTNLDPPQAIRLTNADGREIATLGTTTATVNLGNLEINHKFTVVSELAAPAILGCDFLKKQGIVIDFQKNIVSSLCLPTLQAQLSLNNARMCTLILDSDYPQAIPYPTTAMTPELDMPSDFHPSLGPLLQRHSKIFSKTLGKTPVKEHIINTGT